MNNPKLHHFVARSYQGRFCTPEGRIFVYDKVRPQLGVRLSTPTTEFAETHLYSLITDKGAKDPIYETNFFSELDADFGGLIERVVTSVRNGKRPNLNSSEKSDWDKFIFYQWRRLPEVFGNNSALKNLQAELPKYIEEYESVYGLAPEDEKNRLRDPTSLKRVAQNAMLEAITSAPSDEIIRILDSKGIAIALIQKRSKSFVLGSMPFLRMGPTTHLSDPSVELWLPVSHDIAISPAYSRGTERVITPTDEAIRRINEGIFRQSNKIGSRSRELLESLITRR